MHIERKKKRRPMPYLPDKVKELVIFWAWKYWDIWRPLNKIITSGFHYTMRKMLLHLLHLCI